MKPDQNPALKVSLYSFIILVILFMAGSLLPYWRVWGFNQLAWWFPYSPIVLGAIFIAIALIIYKSNLSEIPDQPNSTKRYLIYSFLITVVLTALFYLLRAKTHFLGDGVQLIPILIDENLALKAKNIGEQWLHIQLFKLLSGSPQERALLSYQLIAYLAGILTIITTLFFAFKIFKNNLQRIIFSLGLFSGGYVLMFFGYVENYSIFAYLILLFSLLGLAGYKNTKCKLAMIVIAALSAWMHIFGLLLLLPLLYLFIYDHPIYKKYGTKNKQLKGVVSFITILTILFLVHLYAQQNIVFRFSLLPPFNDQYILEGYTLFSLKHLFDLLNLIIMTAPFALVVLILFFKRKFRKSINPSVTFFLLLTSLLFFITTVIFEPKLSMPVDWDIFSIFTIPLTVFIFYAILKSSLKKRLQIGGLMLATGFIVLFPRVIIQTNDRLAIKHAFNYCDLDIKRNVKTYRSINDYVKVNDLENLYGTRLNQVDQYYPELIINENGIALKRQQHYPEAIAYFQKAIKEHPGFSAAYYNMADCYKAMGNLEQARQNAEIARGISPDNTNALNLLSGIAVQERQYELALKYINQTFYFDPNNLPAMISLAGVYHGLHDKENYFKTLMRISRHPDASATAFFFLGNFYYGERQIDKAKEAFKTALAKNPEPAQVEQIYKLFADLKNEAIRSN